MSGRIAYLASVSRNIRQYDDLAGRRPSAIQAGLGGMVSAA